MDRKIVSTSGAPKAIGPYSQAVAVGDWLFCSGQIPLDPATGERVTGGIANETERVLQNLEAVLAEAGLGLRDVVKTTIFLVDLGDFQTVNEVYARFFASGPAPARSTVQVVALPRGVSVEIDAIAVRSAGG